MKILNYKKIINWDTMLLVHRNETDYLQRNGTKEGTN